jgi:pimeloyl-ACP methyl ester carboxylesterase
LRLRAAIIAGVLMLAGCAPTPAPNPVAAISSGAVSLYEQVIVWDDCEGSFECAVVAAPLDWQAPDGSMISVSLMRKTGTSSLEPLLVNPGGPGSSAIEWLLASYDSLGSDYLRSNFQVIAFDPRGVGKTSPVDCSNLGLKDQLLYGSSPYKFGTDQDIKYSEDLAYRFAQSCQGDTSTGYYNTQQTANDMELLRILLGDKKLNYLGYSYGTELGATYAVLFPDQVGLFVLDGAVDPTINPDLALLGQIKGFDKALSAYLVDCFTQTNCPLPNDMAEAKDTIAGLLESLENSSMATDFDRDLSLSAAIAGIIVTLYSKENWEFLSIGLDDGLAGDGTTLLLLADFYNDRDSRGGYLTNLVEANYAIACADEITYPDSTSDITEQIAAASSVFGKYFAYGESSCDGWAEGIGNRVLDFNVELLNPVMIVGTTGDPATPYEQAVTLSSLIKGSYLLTFEGEGHTAYGSSDCVGKVVDDYLAGKEILENALNCK